jgi:Ca2+-binding RTX toxin-like protein
MYHQVDVATLSEDHNGTVENKLHNRKESTMRRIVMTMLTTMAMLLVVACGMALAASVINCPNQLNTTSCSGTGQADTMNGSDVYDLMFGKGGTDTMKGNKGEDIMDGGPGTDYVYGGPGDDKDGFVAEGLWGGVDSAGDHVYGGVGNDYLMGGGYSEKGVDQLYGGKGNDLINASQRMSPITVGISKEIVDCGPGTDTVYFDKGLDSVKNCEVKYSG